jgi:hypothetical protein
MRAICTPAALTALTALVTSCCRNVDGARAMAPYRETHLSVLITGRPVAPVVRQFKVLDCARQPSSAKRALCRASVAPSPKGDWRTGASATKALLGVRRLRQFAPVMVFGLAHHSESSFQLPGTTNWRSFRCASFRSAVSRTLLSNQIERMALIFFTSTGLSASRPSRSATA